MFDQGDRALLTDRPEALFRAESPQVRRNFWAVKQRT